MDLMKRVVIESPYAGFNELDIKRNEMYGEFCMRDCLKNYHEAPYASHLLYTRSYVLIDEIPEERELGINAGFCWRDVAELTVFYIDLGISGGMESGMKDCQIRKKKYDERVLPKILMEEFEIEFMEVKAKFEERS